MLIVGDLAPDFELCDAQGRSVRLTERLASHWVVLFFYPKDHTRGCTTEVCAFRDSYQVFQDAGADVIGISSDSQASHQQFAQTHQLPFPLLSDPNGLTRAAYGIPKTFGLLPGRMTFVIDPQQRIRMAYSSQFNAKSHIEKALDILRQGTTP